ncbi:RNA polymerase II C-terminal domain phosphatase-like 3 [Bidens hawaiensis]|uniref:RNA polymerase II C-terminal domain phosphatase-like 3 n=1 Tax=Bidens hawaiensis TaxID=980011 RepID=UPI00404920AC
MEKDLMKPIDVEEGEISVEEANRTAEIDDSKPLQKTQQIWTMEDLVKYQNKYQMSRNYAPGLYNFAWAQAVQNKPLDDYLTTMNNINTTTAVDNNNNNNINSTALDDDKVIVDLSGEDDGESEKEEGELEEGEIDLDLEAVNAGGERNVDKWINVIRVRLESVTVNDANKSFSGVCARLEDMLDSLSTLLSENSVLDKDDLVRLAFAAVQVVDSVFCSMNQNQKEQSRQIMSRMLTNVKSYMSAVFSSEQLKLVENMFLSCNSNDKDNDKEGDGVNHVIQKAASVSEESIIDATTMGPSDQNPKQSETLKSQTSTFKNRVLLPLLDLHKDHDLDSLPSPTRETTNSLPLGKALFVGDAEIRPEWPTPTPRAVTHRYETDALKAVSTYQQKFSKSSFFSSDLPSPTPSEDSGDAGGDCGGEVSSFSNVQTSNILDTTTLEKRDVFSIPERPSVQLFSNARNAAPVYSTSSTVVRAPNKTRDPRLRLANPERSLDINKGTLPSSNKQAAVEPLDSRKQKAFDEPVLVDGPAPKRHKNDFSDSVNPRNIVFVSQTRGLDNAVTSALPSTSQTRGLDNAVTSALPSTSGGSVHIPVTGVSSTSTSLQSLLKDIAVNPTQWMNYISREQMKSVDPASYATQSLGQSSRFSSIPMTTVASQPLVVGKQSTVNTQIPQAASTDDSGKIKMKPRDPRRALLNKSLQKQESITKLPTVEGTKVNVKPADPRLSSQPVSAPDITRQFTKNLKNIADIVSTSASASVQMPSSHPSQVHPSFVNMKGPPSQSGRLQNGPGSGSASEKVASGPGPTQSHNAWGEVEQFFGRFDDQQWAAIQRERSKRMEEQKKMFADRKLCLVLDLDHTLLNSAKFSEIEPVHDEMLRKKEEQDREKPYRHLFRFPHMCMWTKLRPGIWNFLEKASKLYELHLYTMGNKLYATEMAKVLDPKGVLFNGRVISKGGDGDNDGDPKSKDLEGVLGMESAVVIIDDSIRVWPHNKLNLIVVERYIYFPCSRRQFGLPGPSLLEIDHDERPEDGTLASSLAVIEKIHQLFFMEKSLDEADVRNILASEQRKILGGCRIVFSRVIPVGEVSPHLHPLWQTAEQFGAVCTNQIDEHVTHVVANSLGTDKVNWALATGRPVVHPGWVEASALLYRRANEHDFAVKP